MVTALFYGACFIIMFFNPCVKAKIMAGLCLAYLVLENMILWYTSTNVENFDITFYFSIMWLLDSALLFAVGCVVRGKRQILIVSTTIPILAIQVLTIQYPYYFPEWLYEFALTEAHMYFIEVFIFAHVWTDNTIKEWIKTGSVLGLVICAHLVY